MPHKYNLRTHKLLILSIKLLFLLLFLTHSPTRSYQILNPKDISGMDDPKKCTKILIESTSLDPDLYRLGHTKAWVFLLFRKHYLKKYFFTFLTVRNPYCKKCFLLSFWIPIWYVCECNIFTHNSSQRLKACTSWKQKKKKNYNLLF